VAQRWDEDQSNERRVTAIAFVAPPDDGLARRCTVGRRVGPANRVGILVAAFVGLGSVHEYEEQLYRECVDDGRPL
jgi:hypothetical protein